MGALEWACRWMHPGNDQPDWEAGPTGWRLDWDLPLMQGVMPSLSLRVRRPAGAGPLGPLERSRRLALAAQPWSGAEVRLALGATDVERCRAQPGSGGERALLRSTRSLIDLDARIALGKRGSLSLRFRDSQAGMALGDAEIPLGLPARWGEVELSEESAAVARWWDQGEGSAVRIAVQWEGRGGTSGGGSLAAVPRDAKQSGFVAMHGPLGAGRWRSLAPGSTMAEIWLGGTLAGCRCEGALRLLHQSDAVGLGLSLAVRRIWLKD